MENDKQLQKQLSSFYRNVGNYAEGLKNQSFEPTKPKFNKFLPNEYNEGLKRMMQEIIQFEYLQMLIAFNEGIKRNLFSQQDLEKDLFIIDHFQIKVYEQTESIESETRESSKNLIKSIVFKTSGINDNFSHEEFLHSYIRTSQGVV